MKRRRVDDQVREGATTTYVNLSTAALIEHSLSRREGQLSERGALVVRTGKRTGRSPKDKFIVCTPETSGKIWWGSVNRPFDPKDFEALLERVMNYLRGKELFVQDCFVGADPKYRLSLRVITELAWHNLFARQLFIRPRKEDLENFCPDLLLLSAPNFFADPERDKTHSEVFIILHLTEGIILIGGTAYAGEIKKAVFTVMNFLLPERGVLPMHCAANMGQDGDVALFFGLSGTGKTSLSADPKRRLIGDDEHGWSEEGIFNMEGGCYAKCIRLSPIHEPLIWSAIRFGAIIENVVMDERTRKIDFDDDSVTENTRAAYPLDHIADAIFPSLGDHPRHLFFLTCDAFGVLPPIARLTPDQAMQMFLLGYTAKVAGTETGVKEPQATFSPCFGAPFLPRPPYVYAEMLKERLERFRANVWLVNTGWTGGPYGIGYRFPIHMTRAIIEAALKGRLDGVPYRKDPVFELLVPKECPGIDPHLLNPRYTWKDKSAYDAQSRKLAGMWASQLCHMERA